MKTVKLLRTITFIISMVCLSALLMNSGVGLAWLVDREDKELSKFSGQDLDNKRDQSNYVTAAEFKTMAKKAHQVRAKALKTMWSEPEFSNHEKWVTYSEDFSIKRVVDFNKNEISLSVPKIEKNGRADFAAVKAVGTFQLTQLLSTTVNQAIADDPLNDVWNKVVEMESEGVQKQVIPEGEPGEQLVLSELFEIRKPNARTVKRMASKLVQSSTISYESAGGGGRSSSELNKSVELPLAVDRVKLNISLPSDRLIKKAKEYQSIVYQYAKEHNVPPHIVFAIIHTESHFNPLARSWVPAYGLMQIVPRTAGQDVSRVFYNNRVKFSSKVLFDPDQNVKVGTAYLRVLYYHYLKKIKHQESRLYCTIAAYNAGVSNVARAFVSRPRMVEAIPVINNMESKKVLDALLRNLPAKETKDYLRKVLKRAPSYSRLDRKRSA